MADGDTFDKEVQEFLSSAGRNDDGQESEEDKSLNFAEDRRKDGTKSPSAGTSPTKNMNLDEAKSLSETTVNEVIRLAEQADELKEHDVKDEELNEAERVERELKKELEENDGWVKILGNEELMKKVKLQITLLLVIKIFNTI